MADQITPRGASERNFAASKKRRRGGGGLTHLHLQNSPIARVWTIETKAWEVTERCVKAPKYDESKNDESGAKIVIMEKIVDTSAANRSNMERLECFLGRSRFSHVLGRGVFAIQLTGKPLPRVEPA